VSQRPDRTANHGVKSDHGERLFLGSPIRSALCVDLQPRRPMPRSRSVSTAAGRKVTNLKRELSPSKSMMGGSAFDAQRALAACGLQSVNLGRIVLGLRAYPRIAVSHHILVLKIYFSEFKRCDDSTSIKTLQIVEFLKVSDRCPRPLPEPFTALGHQNGPQRALAGPGIGSHVETTV